jgi:formylglycine-generating enzyme required for sulfatase activity
VVATDKEPPEHWRGKVPPVLIIDHPVTHVSWYETMYYAEWLGMRLHTEEEWEKAVHGTGGGEYPWGRWEDGCCNTKEAGIGTTTGVGQYSPQGDNAYGCVDMAGNVFEWTASLEGRYRILRGGSYNHDRDLARCAFRIRHKPSYQFKNIGFRVASDIEVQDDGE